jgi:hypothetical protein
VTVAASRQDGRLLFSITDLGIGMPAADLKVVNGRLAGERLADRTPAAPLGLTVVARLAARHDIGVRLAASGSTGLTAWVELPPALLVADVPEPAGTRVPAPEEFSVPPVEAVPAAATLSPVMAAGAADVAADAETEAGSRELVPALMARASAELGDSAGGPTTRAGFVPRVPQAHASLFGPSTPRTGGLATVTETDETPRHGRSPVEMRERLRLFSVGQARASAPSDSDRDPDRTDLVPSDSQNDTAPAQ